MNRTDLQQQPAMEAPESPVYVCRGSWLFALLINSATLFTCFLALLDPFIDAAFSCLFLHPSAIVDAIVVIACVGLAADILGKAPSNVLLWFGAFSVVTAAAMFSFFFRIPFGSGPVPYEWLNSYFGSSWPLLTLAAGARLAYRRTSIRSQARSCTA
jgi:hypothetical protein